MIQLKITVYVSFSRQLFSSLKFQMIDMRINIMNGVIVKLLVFRNIDHNVSNKFTLFFSIKLFNAYLLFTFSGLVNNVLWIYFSIRLLLNLI